MLSEQDCWYEKVKPEELKTYSIWSNAERPEFDEPIPIRCKEVTGNQGSELSLELNMTTKETVRTHLCLCRNIF